MRTDMTKLIVAFRNFANAPKIHSKLAIKKIPIFLHRVQGVFDSNICPDTEVIKILVVFHTGAVPKLGHDRFPLHPFSLLTAHPNVQHCIV
jgi:hypothetical protein